MSVLVDAGVEEGTVALVGALLDEAGGDDADDYCVHAFSVDHRTAVVVLQVENSKPLLLFWELRLVMAV